MAAHEEGRRVVPDAKGAICPPSHVGSRPARLLAADPQELAYPGGYCCMIGFVADMVDCYKT